MEGRALARLRSQRPLTPAERQALLADIREAIAGEARVKSRSEGSDRARAEAELACWRLIHRFVHRTFWQDRPDLARSAQWREAGAGLAEIAHPELGLWLALQAEVASNRERGIQDLRPRKDGPTLLVTLEFVANRKRKATALLKWAIAAGAEGALSSSAATLTPAIGDLHGQADPAEGVP
jgi:hypothetical protein